MHVYLHMKIKLCSYVILMLALCELACINTTPVTCPLKSALRKRFEFLNEKPAAFSRSKISDPMADDQSPALWKAELRRGTNDTMQGQEHNYGS